MHQTLEASVAALVGELPAVAPLAEAAVPAEPEAAPAGTDAELMEALRQGIEETIARLRELLDRLDRLEQRSR
ncbi:MAG: hypothetical protein PVI01_04520, partial [Gemmatimonadales bacterium]|jgi:hypothetical protein